MARRATLGSAFVLTLNALTAIGEASIYNTSQMKYYRAVDETNTRLRSDDYSFGVQTNSGSRVNHYRFVVVTYSGPHVDQYWSPRRPILGCCSA